MIKRSKKILALSIAAILMVIGGGSPIWAAVKKPGKPTLVMATGVKEKAVISWVKGSRTTGCMVYQYDSKAKKYVKRATVKGSKYVAGSLKRGESYRFKVRAYRSYKGKKYYSSYSSVVRVRLADKAGSTIKNFLKTAIAPAGRTLYIWGGGWNKADTAAGKDAKRIGINGNWYSFFKKQGAGYNYQKYRYKWGKGLDCSGFVGWAVYNVKNTSAGKTGYVTKAKKQGKYLADKGFGTYVSKSKVKNYKAGDVMSGPGHVYIVIGTCSDKSVVLVHSSPKGIQINGTSTPGGKTNSKAVKLAKKYMKKYRSSWYKKYHQYQKGTSYLKDYGQMRWDISGNKLMEDPEGLCKMSADQILKEIFTK